MAEVMLTTKKGKHVLKILLYLITAILLLPTPLIAGKKTTASIIAKETATMMDIGLLKLNSMLANTQFHGLNGATIGAIYNARRGTIDLKVSIAVKKASRSQCKKTINNTKKIFIQTYGDSKVANIHHYFKHEGSPYRNKINWKDLANHVVITAIILTKKNYQHSVYCQSKLMRKKVTY